MLCISAWKYASWASMLWYHLVHAPLNLTQKPYHCYGYIINKCLTQKISHEKVDSGWQVGSSEILTQVVGLIHVANKYMWYMKSIILFWGIKWGTQTEYKNSNTSLATAKFFRLHAGLSMVTWLSLSHLVENGEREPGWARDSVREREAERERELRAQRKPHNSHTNLVLSEQAEVRQQKFSPLAKIKLCV